MQAEAFSSGSSRRSSSGRRSRSLSASNPVHSVLFLILAFVNAAGLFLLLGAEFLAMILVVVYVGAVAVLFLFIVMLLDVDFARMKQGFVQYLPQGALIALLRRRASSSTSCRAGRFAEPRPQPRRPRARCPTPPRSARCSTPAISTSSRRPGMILLTAMIGAIVLTLHHKAGVKRQDVGAQVARTPRPRSNCARSPRGPASEGSSHGPFRLSDARGDRVHDRRRRHHPQPQEHHHHPDVGRADPALGQHQPRRLLDLLAAT